MLELKTGDIFKTTNLVIVNPVNIVGVMGAGLAKEIRKRHPKIMTQYKRRCYYNILYNKDKKKARHYINTSGVTPLSIGNIYLEYIGEEHRYRYILMLPTKKHWRDKSEYKYIRTALRTLGRRWKDMVITSISFPLLGGGLGGLDKKKVLKLMIDELYLIEIPKITIYIPDDLIEYGEKYLKRVQNKPPWTK